LPARRWIAPSTPPPPSKLELAALTIASTARVVMSPSKIAMRSRTVAMVSLIHYISRAATSEGL